MKAERLTIHEPPPPPQRGPAVRRKPPRAAERRVARKGAPARRVKAAPTSEPPAPQPPVSTSVEVQMLGVSSESILQELVASRGLTSRFHRACAAKAAQALARNSPRDAMAWLELLPPAGRVDASGRTVGAQEARDKLWELYLNAVAADQIEEQKEVDRLREENAALRAQLVGAPLQVEGAPNANRDSLSTERTITPSIGDITPPGERTDKPPDPPLREAKPPTVIDVKPVPWDETPSGKAYHEWMRTHPDWDVLCW